MSRKIKALHRWITDECRRGKGDSAARKEVESEVSREISELMESWPQGEDAWVHVEVSIEYPGGD